MNADVELGDLHLRLFPRVVVTGTSLKVRQHGDGDEPLISIERFIVGADVAGVIRHHIAHVQLYGLKIVIPPGKSHPDTPEPVATSGSNDKDTSRDRGPDIIVDIVESDDAQLITLRDEQDTKEGKQPRVWAIHRLTMHNVGDGFGS